MMEPEASIPQWAANLAVSVARIEGDVKQIPTIASELEKLRANTVPMSEHLNLMNRVDVLWNQNVGQQGQWDTVVKQNTELWDNWLKVQGQRTAYRIWLGALSAMTAVLGLVDILSRLGISVHGK